MPQENKKTLVIAAIVLAGFFSFTGSLERGLTTAYDETGRPLFQSQDNRGWHRVIGTATMVSGRDTVALNTSFADGRQDISYHSGSSYGGFAWSTSESNTATYRVIPLSGKSVLILSSSGSDTATVKFLIEGQ